LGQLGADGELEQPLVSSQPPASNQAPASNNIAAISATLRRRLGMSRSYSVQRRLRMRQKFAGL